ncbi:Abscisic acid receptor pyl4, partial [Sarracenia purpurea var. burkii]
ADKHFVKSCYLINDDGRVGIIREVHLISGLPTANNIKRLEILDDEPHVISFSIVGGDRRLSNYQSVTTRHPTPDGHDMVVVKSYVVDTPVGNTKEETCVFVDTIVRCNLQSLAQIAESSARRNSS